MAREIKLSGLGGLLESLDYPTDSATAAAAVDDVTVLLADGEANLGELIEGTHEETFSSPEDLEAALHNALPREAVGEPYQSEGEG